MDETKKRRNSKKDCLFLYFAVFTGSMSFFGGGISMVWTSPVIPKLTSNDLDINPLKHPITSYDVSLIMGLFSIGTILALLVGGKLADAIGRKNTLVIMMILNGVSFLLLAFASRIEWIFVARTINGICLGCFMVALPIFISEITDDHNRGKFGCFMNMFPPLGQLYCFIMGFSFSYKIFSFTCALPILLGIPLFVLFVPETPVYLLHKNKREAAIKSVQKFHGNLSLIEIEENVILLENTVEETTKNHDGGWISLFSYQPNRRGFIIGLGMYMTQVGSGVGVLMSFMGPIFEEAQVGISGNMTAILVGILKLCTFFFVANIVERLGRKSLMLISATLCSLALFFLGVYFFMKERNIGSYQNFSAFSVASILFFIIAYSIGLGPITSATLGELFSSNVRAKAVSIATFLGQVLGAILSSSFPIVLNYIGISGCIWIFSGICLLGAIFVYFMMPETKGKSISEIQDMLKNKRNY